MRVLRADPDHKKAREAIQVRGLSSSLSHIVSPLCTQRSKNLLAMKDRGNSAFRNGLYQEAYDIYSEALLIDPLNKSTNAKLYCNRALMASKVRNRGLNR